MLQFILVFTSHDDNTYWYTPCNIFFKTWHQIFQTKLAQALYTWFQVQTFSIQLQMELFYINSWGESWETISSLASPRVAPRLMAEVSFYRAPKVNWGWGSSGNLTAGGDPGGPWWEGLHQGSKIVKYGWLVLDGSGGMDVTDQFTVWCWEHP